MPRRKKDDGWEGTVRGIGALAAQNDDVKKALANPEEICPKRGAETVLPTSAKGKKLRIPMLVLLSLPQVQAKHAYLSCHRSIPSNFLNPISISRRALDRGGGGRQKRRRASGCGGCRCGFDFPLYADASAECGCGSDGDYGEWGDEFFHGDNVCCLIIVPAI